MKKGVLMISSSSIKGGGPENMFKIGSDLSNKFRIFYAIPQTNEYRGFLNNKNHIKISERKVTVRDILRLIKFIKVNSINIIHAHGKGAGLLGRLLKLFLGKSLIYTFHGIHIIFYNEFIKKIYIIYENTFGRLDSMKIFVSESEKDYANKINLKINKFNYSIINNCVPNQKKIDFKIDQKIINASINISNDSKNIITICRLVEQKNIFEILRIAKLLHNYNFIILGNGPLWNQIQNYILKKDIKNVYMPGQINNVFKYLYASRIYLSTSFYEGLSISILEAMSIGLPIIASNVVGNVDAIEHLKSGFLYDLGKINLAADYILKIMESEKLFFKLSKYSQLRQRNYFSTKKMISAYLKMYKTL